MAGFDPTGGDLKRQALASYYANRDAQRAADYSGSTPGNMIDQAVHATGPLPDPQWSAFLQALNNQNVSGFTTGQKTRGRPAPDSTDPMASRQLQGTSVQPDYFTGGDTFMGQETAMGALKRRALQAATMPPDQATYEAQLYGTNPPDWYQSPTTKKAV